MEAPTEIETAMATPREVQKILDRLADVKKLVIVGEGGVGKTWMAEEVAKLASEKGITYVTVWFFPVEKTDRDVSLESFASKLALLSSTEEWDDEDKEEPRHREKEAENLKKKITQKLKLLKSMNNGNVEDERFLLVVLDDFTDSEGHVDQFLKDILSDNHFKVLITRKTSEKKGDSIEADSKIIHLKRLTPGDSLSLLRTQVNHDISENQKFKDLADKVAEKCWDLPAAIVMLAEVFNHISGTNKNLELEIAMVDAAALEKNSIGSLLHFVYENLPTDSIRSCFWFSRLLFLLHGPPIHFNELITYWLLEGCFDHQDTISMAYEEGHHVLMELRDRGILMGQNNYVYMVKEIWGGMEDTGKYWYTNTMRLGLAYVQETDVWDALKGITLGDGMMKTISRGKHKKEISTLVIDGNRLSRENLNFFFRSMPGLKILAILNPKIDSLDKILPMLNDLKVLILRGCHFLENADQVKELTKLSVLEVSGASSLEGLDKDLLKKMKNLQLVNLTGLELDSIPDSLSNCVELRLLILRECLRMKDLPNLKALPNLEVLDVSGSQKIEKIPDGNINSLKKLHTLNISRTNMKKFPIMQGITCLKHVLVSGCPYLTILRDLSPMTKLKVLNLSSNSCLKDINNAKLRSLSHLEVLDLSHSGITRLPPPEQMCNVSRLLLRGCGKLDGSLSTLSLIGLEVLDLSGSVHFPGISETSFDHLKCLRHLDLSGTKIKNLPPLSPLKEQLRKFLLKDCKDLTTLQNLGDLEKLEILDLSGCGNLKINQGESFKNMSRLRILDLSETTIEGLAEDCFPANLCHLVMRKCTPIKQFPQVGSLSKLEKLDLCGSTSLGNVGSDFLKNLSALQVLNLSEVPIEELDLSPFTKLQELSLKGCPCVPSGLEGLKELKLLDLSKTNIKSLETHSNLIELRLRGCSCLIVLKNLQSLTKLEVLDLFETKIRDFPYEISKFACLRELHLPGIHDIDWTKVEYIPEEFNLTLGVATSHANPTAVESDGTTIKCPYILISGTKFFSFLKSYPDLWDSCFKEFHFSVWPCKEQGKVGISYLPGDMSMSKYVNPKGRFPRRLDHRKLLEIHGSCDFAGGNGLLVELKDALTRAEHISVIDNDKVTRICKLGEDIVASMESCWLERCPKIHSIFSGAEDAGYGERLKSLYLCNLCSLQKVCDGSFSSVLGNLENLYLDCCPELKNLFHASKVLPRLQTLKVKFCYKLEALFEADTSTENHMLSLHTLELLDLPNMKSIFPASKVLPRLQTLKVKFCYKLEALFEAGTSTENCMPSLHMLELLELPKIKSIGFQQPVNSVVRHCPELKSEDRLI